MASKSAERKEPVTRGTGNVFADLGFPDASERQARLRLAYALNQELEARKLSQADAAKVLGVTQPKVSALRDYKLAGFSVERLMNLLTALDQDVEIAIRRKPRSRKSARISVVAAYDLQALQPKTTSPERRSFTSAKGLDLQWTPPASRDALHDRGKDREAWQVNRDTAERCTILRGRGLMKRRSRIGCWMRTVAAGAN